LLLASAEQARAAGEREAHAVALADAVITANRFSSGFPEPVPPEQLHSLQDEAAAASDPDAPAVAARLAAAAFWTTYARTAAPDPERAEAALAAAGATGDPVLISGGLDALGTVNLRAGRLRQARELAREQLTLLNAMDHHHPYPAPEILAAFHVAWLSAFVGGDLPAALSTAEMIMRDDLLGSHPYRPATKIIPPLVLMGRFNEALIHADPMWDGWQRSGAPVAA